MKKYEKAIIEEKVLSEVYCNKCGRLILTKDGVNKTDYLSIKKEWGYSSEKDSQVHSFDLCESCYDSFVRSFNFPIDIKKKL